MGRTREAADNTGNVQEKMEIFHRRCHDAGLRVTPQRTAIYKVLVETDQHPSAEMVFRQVRQVFPCISLDTVNRTLLTLSEIGTAFVVEGSGDAKRFDANLESHQHFKCVKCKRIVDFRHEPFEHIGAPENLPGPFKVLRTTVYVEGVCDLCLAGGD